MAKYIIAIRNTTNYSIPIGRLSCDQAVGQFSPTVKFESVIFIFRPTLNRYYVRTCTHLRTDKELDQTIRKSVIFYVSKFRVA